MARAVALSEMRARVRQRVDIGPDTTSSSARWPNAAVNREINQSWQALRRKLVQTQGARQLYCQLTTGTTSNGVTSGKAWTDLTLPATMAHLVGLEILLITNRWRALKAISFDQRTRFFNSFGLQTGSPRYFFVYNVGVESAASVTAGTLGLLPATDKAYTYNLWTVPPWTDRTTDTDVFDGIEGHEDWAVWDAVRKIAISDGGAEGGMGAVAQLAAEERQIVEDDVMRAINGIQREGPMTVMDVAEQEAMEQMDDIFRYGAWWQ